MKARIMNADYKKKYAKIALPSDYERWVKSKKFFFWGMLLAIAIVIFEAFLVWKVAMIPLCDNIGME